MSITLEWVVLPNGIYLRTICKKGVPLPDPTRYLLSYAYPDHGSTQVDFIQSLDKKRKAE